MAFDPSIEGDDSTSSEFSGRKISMDGVKVQTLHAMRKTLVGGKLTFLTHCT